MMYGVETTKEFSFVLDKNNWELVNDIYIQKIQEDVLDHETIITGYKLQENEELNIELYSELSKIFEVGTIEGFIIYKATSPLGINVTASLGVL